MLATGPDAPPDTAEWHADCTFRSSPPFLSVLAALELPEVGGDTLFASAFAALASLPAPLCGHLEGLSAAHDAGSFRNNLAIAMAEQQEGAERLQQTAVVWKLRHRSACI